MRWFVIVFMFVLLLSACSERSKEKQTATWCFKEQCFELEVADTVEERQQGLMFRESLAEDAGMLFLFEQTGTHPFWMKNTLIPLDIIWLDENLSVVAVMSAEPCIEDPCEVYNPEATAKYVIELNKGSAEILAVSVGDGFGRR